MISGKITINRLAETEYEQFLKLNANSDQGSIYSSPQYLDILCSSTGGSYEILGAFRGDELHGGVAVYSQNLPYGKYIGNWPLLYYHSVLLKSFKSKYPSETVSRQLAVLSAVAEHFASIDYDRLVLHNRGTIDTRVFLTTGWSVRPSYSYVATIDDLEKTRSLIERNQRRLIKRCEENNISMTDDDDFDSFFDMHRETHQRKGAPLHLEREPYRRYMKAVLSAGLGKLLHARNENGRSLACQLVLLGDHEISHTVCAAADPDQMKLGTTPFLRWKAFELLNKLGYKGNDLTDAALNPVSRFKGQLGAKLVTNMVCELQSDSFKKAQRPHNGGLVGNVIRKLAGR